ncbi:uncharacterized protein LOC129953828 [Eupeodes corollae]|uniref:uncharacterized protein LOC129953828 n=1 Tax=Eupeodes corollae TaxID=290404 RepID=UPI00249277F3|nr:uncharacterized protein LOC129953828 [Eupeodes corollae]
MERLLLTLFLIISIRFCYQQDTNVCPIGTDFFNGMCVRSLCPETHYLVNGACLLRPTETASCGFGFDLINGMCVQQNCPPNFIMINGLCQEVLHNTPTLYCPSGFSIQHDMCIPNPGIILPSFCQARPCRTYQCQLICYRTTSRPTSTTPTEWTKTTSTTTMSPPITTSKTETSPTTTTSPTPPTTTTTTKSPCSPDHVIIDGECRFVYCRNGTFYRGRCIQPVCAHGLVWTGLTCTHPEVITTILEIKNNFNTESNQTGPEFHAAKTITNIVYLTEKNEAAKEEINYKNNCTTTISGSNGKCCFIVTPRMCKKYNTKWVCFNRQYRQCGEICGIYSVKYLKVDKVIEYPGMLVIPPNPELQGCSKNECKISDAIDCSGCLANQKQTCSPYCYRYRCPNNRCTFIDQSEYCKKYRGSPGCSSSDGCFEDYCYEETASQQECQ